MGFWPSLLLEAAAMCSLMFVVWVASVRIRNAGLVDIAWAAGFSILACLDALLAEGYEWRRLIIALMATLWSLRLAVHLSLRVMGDHPHEDGRYEQLRKEWRGNIRLKFLGFFQLQGLLVLLLAVPFLLACLNPEPRIHALEWTGLGLWLLAVAGESTADRQLQRFKADPANSGWTCQIGLWRYSRHPNYFFEWLVWCAYFIFALASPFGFVTFYCPLLMLYLLFRVTGIPKTEEQAVRTRGEEYRRYQRTTRVFVPWFPKRDR